MSRQVCIFMYVFVCMHVYIRKCTRACMYTCVYISLEPGANAKRLWGQSVCQRAFSLLEIWCLRPWWVRILLSAEEDNLSLFDSNIACLCQSITINNSKHVYRQSQVRMPNGCGVKWAECSLIIGTGCWVQVLDWSSIAQSFCQWAFSLLAIWCLRPWWVRILLSAEEHNLSPFDSNIACLCQSIEINNNKHVHVSLLVPLYLLDNKHLWIELKDNICFLCKWMAD